MPILFEQVGGTAVLSLSRPEARNCWGTDFSEGLAGELERLAKDKSVRAVIITGDEKGRAFSAGANLKDPNTHTIESMEDFFEELPKWREFVVRKFDAFPKRPSEPSTAMRLGWAASLLLVATL